MTKRRICAWVLVGAALVLAAGLRTGTGQGYSDPVVMPATPTLARSPRILEVRLTNRKTGRPQSYQWSVSVPAGGSVEVECHEWTLVSFFGFSLPGLPKNSFRRVIPLDHPEEGMAGPYHFVIRWRTKDGT
jgi:hypothetical protein